MYSKKSIVYISSKQRKKPNGKTPLGFYSRGSNYNWTDSSVAIAAGDMEIDALIFAISSAEI